MKLVHTAIVLPESLQGRLIDMLYFLNFDLILDKAFISDAFNNMSFNTDVAPWCYKWMATPAPSQ